MSAAKICTAYRKKPAEAEPKTPTPAAPMINAGPELLQKTMSRDASSRLTSPCALSRAMYAAPKGYPPVTPIMNAETPWPDMPSRAPSGASAFDMSFDAPSSFKRLAAMKNGNSDGMIICAHIISPAFTASAAAFGKTSSAANMPNDAKIYRAFFILSTPCPCIKLCFAA